MIIKTIKILIIRRHGKCNLEENAKAWKGDPDWKLNHANYLLLTHDKMPKLSLNLSFPIKRMEIIVPCIAHVGSLAQGLDQNAVTSHVIINKFSHPLQNLASSCITLDIIMLSFRIVLRR